MTGHAYRFLLALVCAAVVVVAWSLPATASFVVEQPGRVLSVAALAALLLFSPLTISRRGRAATMTFGETAAVIAYVSLPPAAAALALSAAAVLLAATLPSAPINRLFNGASATVSLGAGAAVVAVLVDGGVDALLAAAVGAVIAGTLTHLNVLVVLSLARGRVVDGAVSGLPRLAAAEVLAVAVGLALAPLVRDNPDGAWHLLPLLVALALMSRSQRALSSARELLDGVVSASRELHATLHPDQVLAVLHAQAVALLPQSDVQVLATPPGEDEVGVQVRAADGEEPVWLVACAGVPQVNVPAEERVLEALAGAARTALDNAALHARLDEQTRRDPLTGLPNRVALVAHLQAELDRCQRQSRQVGLLFLDLDGFKSVNDRLGHSAGDAVLQRFSARLQTAVRRSDLVARLSGDEFCVVLHDLDDREHAAERAAEVQQLLSERSDLEDVTASLGLAVGPDDGADVASLLRVADAAMYEDKRRRGSAPRAGERTG